MLLSAGLSMKFKFIPPSHTKQFGGHRVLSSRTVQAITAQRIVGKVALGGSVPIHYVRCDFNEQWHGKRVGDTGRERCEA